MQLNYLFDRGRGKLKFLFWGATFHIPLTKSATLNRLFHCTLWQISGAFFCCWGLCFCNLGAISPRALGIFSLDRGILYVHGLYEPSTLSAFAKLRILSRDRKVLNFAKLSYVGLRNGFLREGVTLALQGNSSQKTLIFTGKEGVLFFPWH